MIEVKQYEIDGNKLTLKVKKAHFFVRAVMFLFAIISFLLPVMGMTWGIAMGKGMHIGYLIGLFMFGISGFYMLKISLWNTFGKEFIVFHEKKVEYLADFGWFKGEKREEKISHPIEFGVRQMGYSDDECGGLIIGIDESSIYCATKMPYTQLEELILNLQKQNVSKEVVQI